MPHIADDELRSLALDELRTRNSLRFQRHIYTCAPCLERLAAVTFALAAQGLEPKKHDLRTNMRHDAGGKNSAHQFFGVAS